MTGQNVKGWTGLEWNGKFLVTYIDIYIYTYVQLYVLLWAPMGNELSLFYILVVSHAFVLLFALIGSSLIKNQH